MQQVAKVIGPFKSLVSRFDGSGGIVQDRRGITYEWCRDPNGNAVVLAITRADSITEVW